MTVGYNRPMSMMVDTEKMLADALRALLPLAVSDEPDWLPKEGAIERRKAYVAARIALDIYDEAAPAAVTPLKSVAQERPGGALAIAS